LPSPTALYRLLTGLLLLGLIGANASASPVDRAPGGLAQQGRWVAIEPGADFERGLPADLSLPSTTVSPAGGGTLWYELTFSHDGQNPLVLDFASSSTLDHFVHYVLDHEGQLAARLEGGYSQPGEYQFFLRHGRELTLPEGNYRVLTRMQSPFFLALPEPRVFPLEHYSRQIPYSQSLTLLGLGIFLGLLFYYAVMSVWRRNATDALYALFILGNLLYNGAALLVYNHLFSWSWFYLISTPILFSNAIYIGFVIRLLGIRRDEQPVLFWLGMTALAVLVSFWPMALIWPNWSLEFCRIGVAIFALYGLLCGVVRSFQGSRVAQLYLIANAAFAIPALFAITLQSVKNPIYLVEHLGMVAVLIEVLLLAQVLSYQIGQVYRQRTEVEENVRRGALLDNLTAQAPGVIYQMELSAEGKLHAPFASRRIADFFEVSAEEVQEDTDRLFQRVHPEDYRDLMASIIHSARHLTTWRAEFRVLLPRQGMKWLEGTAQPERLTDNSTRWYGFVSDATERKVLEEHMRHMAQHDSLTNLPNRALFRDRLDIALERARRQATRSALMFVDLDHFKAINDQYGHEIGDALLQALSQALSVNLRAVDTVARMGGDEFVILLETVNSVDEAVAVAEKLRRNCERPIRVQERVLHISVSIGISIFPDHASDSVGLIRTADHAMYRAKEAGRNQVRVSAHDDKEP